MDAARLVEAACSETGLDDFGAPTYREGLDRLVASLEDEARLNDVGRIALEAQVRQCLANRLRVTAWLGEHPEALDAPVARPIVVLGLPRTGTTLLSELLARDPANRPLRRWEATDSVPPPDAAHLDDDPRVEAARVASAAMDALNPGFRAIHHEEPDGPTECVTLLAQDFTSLLWETVANIHAYGEWLLARDQTPAYEYHRRVLHLLQWRAPGRWSLKTPHHGLAVDALLGQYPDARLVMTHRDPVTVVASLCSLVRSLSGTFSDADHDAYIERRWTAVAEAIVTRVAASRDAHGDDAFVDVQYPDLVADPVGTVRRIYAHFGEDLSASAAAAMHAHAVANPQGKHGVHTYDLDRLGLRREELADRFAPYRARFGVAADPAGG